MNFIWLLLPMVFGFFAMWKMTEYDLKIYKKQYYDLIDEINLEKRDKDE